MNECHKSHFLLNYFNTTVLNESMPLLLVFALLLSV